MIEITSTSNPTIKHIKSLKLAKYRKEYNQFVVEGQRMVEEALEYGNVEYIVYSDRVYSENEPEEIMTYMVEDEIFETLCETKSPQGMLAVVAMNMEQASVSGDIIIALEDVQNPLNVGAIIRTADALGAGGIVLSGSCADIYSPKVIRGTMGSVFHIPIIKTDDFHSILQEYKNQGYTLVAGDLQGQQVEKTQDKLVLVVGNEGNGITEITRNLCDVLWRLNMPGKAESLNAAVALGIMLYTAVN